MTVDLKHFDLTVGWVLASAFAVFPSPLNMKFEDIGTHVNDKNARCFQAPGNMPARGYVRRIWQNDGLISADKWLPSRENETVAVGLGGVELAPRTLAVLRYERAGNPRDGLGDLLISALQKNDTDLVAQLSQTVQRACSFR